jgi:recombination protein RecT
MSEQIQTQQPTSLKGILSSEKMRQQFALALPKHLTPERFCRVAITALTRTPKLADCTQESFFKCLLDLSAMGLEPDGRRAHLIPYGNTCTLILDWKGIAELALRSGLIAKLHADIVCENDAFVYDMGEVTTHSIDWRKPRGAMYAAYAMAQTKTGERFFAVMTKDEIDGIRKRSKAGQSGPWVTDYNEMAKKTAFRRLSKWLPLSAEFRDAVDVEGDVVEFTTTSRQVKQAATPMPAALMAPEENDSSLANSPQFDSVVARLEAGGFTPEEFVAVMVANGETIAGDTFGNQSDDTLQLALDQWPAMEAAMTAAKGGRK